MDNLIQSRLDDFKKILTFHIISKIHYKYGFNDNYNLYYEAPKKWKQWRSGEIKYSRFTFKYLALFNSTALDRNQVKAIFGKDESGKIISYVDAIKSDLDIIQFNKGTIVIKGKRYPIAKRYQLPYEYIKSIFDDPDMLAKVLDVKSDFYTKRQRRLIFNQILMKDKRKKQRLQKKTEEQQVQEIIDEME